MKNLEIHLEVLQCLPLIQNLPHLKTAENVQKQSEYESKHRESGADLIIESVIDLKKIHKELFET